MISELYGFSGPFQGDASGLMGRECFGHRAVCYNHTRQAEKRRLGQRGRARARVVPVLSRVAGV